MKRQYVPLDTNLAAGKFGTALYEKWGFEGLGVWAMFLAACKRGSPQGQFRYVTDQEAWQNLGGLFPAERFTLDEFFRFTGNHKKTRRSRHGRITVVICTVWGDWNKSWNETNTSSSEEDSAETFDTRATDAPQTLHTPTTDDSQTPHRRATDDSQTVQRRSTDAPQTGETPANKGVLLAPELELELEHENEDEETPKDISRIRELGISGQVDHKPVTDQESSLAAAVLGEWNTQTGQHLRAREWLAKIVCRCREHPEITLQGHAIVIRSSLAHPWWNGTATPSVVYGSGAQFERSLLPPSNGKQALRYGRGMTTAQMLATIKEDT